MRRAARAAGWIIPGLFCLTVYWLGLWIWFMQDDFAWLSLNLQWHEGHDPWKLLFAPAAQGTIRPWSERLFFIGFYELFGLDAFPYRVWIYLTQLANLALLGSITRRLTGSRHAGLWAPVFWVAGAGVAATMAWNSTYNQILCAFFLLLAFHFFLRHIETGQVRYYVLQWLVFLLGFGALEMNVVYPALAAAYAICRARRWLRWTIPLFAVSAAYTLLHYAAAPRVSEGPYAMHFDAALPATLWKYWTHAFGGIRLQHLYEEPLWGNAGVAATWLVSLALLGFLTWKLRQKQWLAGFLILWFLILVAPVLPLRDHFSDYYLTLPTIGLSMLGGWALAAAWKAAWGWRLLGTMLAGLYLATSLPVGRAAVAWSFQRSNATRNLVLGVARAHELHPGKIILLNGVGSDLFWSAVRDRPFRLIGVPDVYLTPGSEDGIQARWKLADLGEYVLPPRAALRALSENRAVVYDASGARLRNITKRYKATAPALREPELARRVDVGQPLFADQLGPGWYEAEGGHRWMPARAVVHLGGPRSGSEKLYVTGYCPAAQVEQGPVRLAVFVDGGLLATVELTEGDARFDFSFPLPGQLAGKDSVEVALQVDRTFVAPGDGRELGVAFGVLAIR